MDKMPSTQFRTTYTSLTTPTQVTVNGHAIGTWLPSPYSTQEFRAETPPMAVSRTIVPDDHFSTRPFTPVPKVRAGR
jgi:hypothetical protein